MLYICLDIYHFCYFSFNPNVLGFILLLLAFPMSMKSAVNEFLLVFFTLRICCYSLHFWRLICGDRILVDSSFTTWKMPLPASLPGNLLFSNCFSLILNVLFVSSSFSSFLSLTFRSLMLICLIVDFFGFIPICGCSASWILGFDFAKLEEFLFLWIHFPVSHFFSYSSGTLKRNARSFLMAP